MIVLSVSYDTFIMKHSYTSWSNKAAQKPAEQVTFIKTRNQWLFYWLNQLYSDERKYCFHPQFVAPYGWHPYHLPILYCLCHESVLTIYCHSPISSAASNISSASALLSLSTSVLCYCLYFLFLLFMFAYCFFSLFNPLKTVYTVK